MANLEVELIPALSDNYVYVVRESGSGTTGVVDPAVAAPVMRRLAEQGWNLNWILITHHHGDHTGGNLELKERTGCKIAGPERGRSQIPGLDVTLGEGDRFRLGDAEALILETPGHTLDHISYWFEEAGTLFCADTLFSLGCGRVFEGTMEQMWGSLQKFEPLPDDARIYCGHEYTLANAKFALTVDPGNPELEARAAEVERLRAADQPTIPSTLGLERRTNPFLRPADPGIRRHLGMEQASDAEVFGEIRRRKDRF